VWFAHLFSSCIACFPAPACNSLLNISHVVDTHCNTTIFPVSYTLGKSLRLLQHNPLPCSEDDLWVALQEELYEIHLSFIRNLCLREFLQFTLLVEIPFPLLVFLCSTPRPFLSPPLPDYLHAVSKISSVHFAVVMI